VAVSQSLRNAATAVLLLGPGRMAGNTYASTRELFSMQYDSFTRIK
jgi:hypothetical protein